MKHLWLPLLLTLLVGVCNPIASAMPAPGDSPAGCYSQRDVLRYNTLNVQLREDGTFYAEYVGDIGLWGTSTGTWRSEKGRVVFKTEVVEDAKPLPDFLEVRKAAGRYTLRLPASWDDEIGTHFSPLAPVTCVGFGSHGKSFDRKGAPQPMPDGVYEFAHRSAEHPGLGASPVWVRVTGRNIVVIRDKPWNGLPVGVLAEGRLAWGLRVGKWIIAKTDADKDATEAGGCSDGPEVIDIDERIYWTC